MHILYLIPGLGGSGGAEQAVAALAGPFAERGVRLDVVTFNGCADLAPAVVAAGGTVTDLGTTSRLRLVPRVDEQIRRRRPDLVHTTLFDADVAGRLAGRRARVPVVSSLVNVAYGPEQRANPAIRSWKLAGVRRADQLTARVPVRFHALSAHVAEVMGPRLSIPADRIDVIPRGRDRAALGVSTPERRRHARQTLGIDDDRPLVLALARHEYQKGLDVLVKAWPEIAAAVPGAALRLGGRSGGQSGLVAGLVDGLGPDADVLDVGMRADVPDLLCGADAFVVPSRWEGLGSVLVEAMALGVPVVSSDVGPIPEVTGSDWARLVPPDDPRALAGAVIETLRQTTAERAERAQVAHRRFTASFTLDSVADAMVAFYRRSLAAASDR